MAVPSGSSFEPRDVRMRGFSHRTRVEDVFVWIDSHATSLDEERVSLDHLAGRVLAADVVSDTDVPCFDRAMMDGYAVLAHNTLGASAYNRLRLKVVGEVLPGERFSGTVTTGTAVRIMTGAPLPEGADAVLPAEKVETESGDICALDEVSPGKHVGRRGEDVARSTIVLRKGRRLRPQDLGVLSSIGVAAAPVVRQPRVRIVVTGNELLPAGQKPTDIRIADANSPMLASLIRRDGAIPLNPGIVADDPTAILDALREPADIIIVSGGSSVGCEDYAPSLLARHGQLSIHGVAMRPSSPVGMGTLEDRLVFLLPGNPVSCLCGYDFFAGRAVRLLSGLSKHWPYRKTMARLSRKLVSMVGRVDYVRVVIRSSEVEPLAIGGASVLSSTTRADGFVVVPADSEGYPAQAEVCVWHYD